MGVSGTRLWSMKRGDTSPSLDDSLSANGGPVDLTGATVEFSMEHMQGLATVTEAAEVLAPEVGGHVRRSWDDGDTDVPGIYRVGWRATFPDGSIETFDGDRYLFVEVSGHVTALGPTGRTTSGRSSRRTLTIKRGDTMPVLAEALRVGDVPIDLTGATVLFVMTQTLGAKTVTGAATVTAAATGGVEYRWSADDTMVPGIYRAEWQITFPSGQDQTVPGSSYRYVEVLGLVVSAGGTGGVGGGCGPATSTTLGTIKLTGDLEGTANRPLVRGLPSRIIGGSDDDGVPTITIESYWGIDSGNEPYFDPDGVPDEEAAVFGFDADGNPTLTTVNGVIVYP